MTAPSVPTAEDFAKARAALGRATVAALLSSAGVEDLQTIDATLASAEAAIERLRLDAQRWRVIRTRFALFGAPIITPASADAHADALVKVDRLVSPPEPEKP